MAKVPRNSPGGCPTVRVLGMVHASLEFVTTIPLKCPVALPWMVAGAAPRALRCGCMVMWEEAMTPTSIPSVQGACRHHVTERSPSYRPGERQRVLRHGRGQEVCSGIPLFSPTHRRRSNAIEPTRSRHQSPDCGERSDSAGNARRA